jgi:hypothetical protein
MISTHRERHEHVGAHDDPVPRRSAGGVRRTTVRSLTLSVALLIAAMIAGVVPVAAARSEAPTWKEVARTLSDRVKPSSPNPCNRGEHLCIELVLSEMLRRMGPIARKCSHHAPFGATYAIVTQHFSRGWPFTLRDPSYIGHMDALFADAYFDAYDAWKRGRSVAPAWETAFDAAHARAVTGLGNMLLGMNAHITNDLPFVIERIGVLNADGDDAYEEFAAANELLADVQRATIDAVANEFDPSVADVSVPGLFVGRDGFVALVGAWRAESWARAQQLLAAPTRAERRAVVDEIEATARSRAVLIRTATSYVPGLSSPSARDQHCRAQHP